MGTADSTKLKLAALDEDDLQVISAAMQDAILRVADMAYLPSENRFALVANRFAWEVNADRKSGPYERRQTGMQIARVTGADYAGLQKNRPEGVLELLAVRFELAEEPPAGTIFLTFAGGAAVRLGVECIEVAMADMGAAWTTRNMPSHDDDENAG